MALIISAHARRRCAQRHLTPADIEVVRRYGRKLHRTGIVFYFLGRRDLPQSLRRQDGYARLAGTVLLVSADGVLITLYRNQKALRCIRRKPKQRIRLKEKRFLLIPASIGCNIHA